MNIDMVVVNQTSCIINKNESYKVKTNNIEEEKTEATQELVPMAQSIQVLKEDTSIIRKNREKTNGIYTVWDIPRHMSPCTFWKELGFFGN
ncbi:20416_t:CDS:1, partial [Gigaspora margarita]